jgi:lipoate-protein ligase A
MSTHEWRFIYTGQGDPYFNMAVDETLLSSVQNGSPPILRVYEWNPPGVSMGYFQAVNKTVDRDKCLRKGMKLVRRITGGRAVLHNEELTYSFSGSCKIFPELGDNIFETYKQISKALLSSLSILGIEAQWIKPLGGKINTDDPAHKKENKPYANPFFSLPCFSSFSRYEISYQGRKLVGSAQRRFREIFLQHGSILLKKGELDLADFLPANSFIKGAKLLENSTSIEEIKGKKIERKEIIRALKRGFSEAFQKNLEEDSLTEDELKTAQKLTIDKYSKDDWNFRY